MDLAKAAIDRMGIDVGLDVDIESEAPPGSGLGGSSALVTAVVAALACLDERDARPASEVARLSYAIERDDLGISGGWQDQYAAAFGGFNLIEFGRDGAVVTPVDAGPDALEELRKHLLLCYTGTGPAQRRPDRPTDRDVRGRPRGDAARHEAAARDGLRDARRDRGRRHGAARRDAARGVRGEEADEPAHRRGHADRGDARRGPRGRRRPAARSAAPAAAATC